MAPHRHNAALLVWLLAWCAPLLLACAGGAKTDDSATTDDSADTTDDSGSADDSAEDTAPTCAALNSGDDWNFNGECPQMRTPCDIVVEGCSLTIDYAAESCLEARFRTYSLVDVNSGWSPSGAGPGAGGATSAS